MKYHLNIQSKRKLQPFKMRRYIQAEIKFSDFCDVQTNIVEYFVENIISIYFPLLLFYCRI